MTITRIQIKAAGQGWNVRIWRGSTSHYYKHVSEKRVLRLTWLTRNQFRMVIGGHK